ncbi:MAG: hypothetical protein ACYDD1_15980 [Caulobacteraceae bacterium]
MAEHAIGRLSDHKADVEHRPYGEGGAEACGRMMMVAVMVVAMVVAVVAVILAMGVTVVVRVTVPVRISRPMIMVVMIMMGMIGGAMLVGRVGMIVHVFTQGSIQSLPYQQYAPRSQTKPSRRGLSAPPASRG